jgi:hypothetical protein
MSQGDAVSDADLARAVVESAVSEVARLTEQVRIRDVHIEALKATIEKRDRTIAQLRLELARLMKGQ